MRRTLAALALIALCTAPALAVERNVLMENFTNGW